jgi:uridine phosphorylase
LRIGDLVVPVSAISEEGTSRHYPIGGIPLVAAEELNGMVEDALNKNGRAFSKGGIWTTDAPYREMPEQVEFYQKRGVLAVEMELSALMTLALYREVKLGGLLVVSDELFNLKWHAGFSNPKLKRSSRYAGELLVQLVASQWG